MVVILMFWHSFGQTQEGTASETCFVFPKGFVKRSIFVIFTRQKHGLCVSGGYLQLWACSLFYGYLLFTCECVMSFFSVCLFHLCFGWLDSLHAAVECSAWSGNRFHINKQKSPTKHTCICASSA